MALKWAARSLLLIQISVVILCQGEIEPRHGKFFGDKSKTALNDHDYLGTANGLSTAKLRTKHVNKKVTTGEEQTIFDNRQKLTNDKDTLHSDQSKKPLYKPNKVTNSYPKKYKIKLKKYNPGMEYYKDLMRVTGSGSSKERKPRSAKYGIYNQPKSDINRGISMNPDIGPYSNWDSYSQQGNYHQQERSQIRQYSFNRNVEKSSSLDDIQQPSVPSYSPYRASYGITRNQWGNYANQNNNNKPNSNYDINAENSYYGNYGGEQVADYHGQQQIDQINPYESEFSQKQLDDMAEMEQVIERELTKYYGSNDYSTIKDALQQGQQGNYFSPNAHNSYLGQTNEGPYGQKEQLPPVSHSVGQPYNSFGNTKKQKQEFSTPNVFSGEQQYGNGGYQQGQHYEQEYDVKQEEINFNPQLEDIGQVHEDLGMHQEEIDLGQITQKEEQLPQSMSRDHMEGIGQYNTFQSQQNIGMGPVEDNTNFNQEKENDHLHLEEMPFSQQHENMKPIKPYVNPNQRQEDLWKNHKEPILNDELEETGQTQKESNLGQIQEDVGQYQDEALGQIYMGQIHEDAQYEEALGQVDMGQMQEDGQYEEALGQVDMGQIQEEVGQYEEALGQVDIGQVQEDVGQYEKAVGQVDIGQVQEDVGQYEEAIGQVDIGQIQEDVGQYEKAVGQVDIGQVQDDVGQYEEALGQADIGQIQEDVGQYEEVGKYEETLGQVNMGQLHEDVNLGQVQEYLGQYKKEKNTEKKHKEVGPFQDDVNLGQVQEDVGQYQEEMDLGQQYEGSEKNSKDHQFHGGQEQEDIGHFYQETESQQHINEEFNLGNPEYMKKPVNSYSDQTHTYQRKHQKEAASGHTYNANSYTNTGRTIEHRNEWEENVGQVYARTIPINKYVNTQSEVKHEDKYHHNSYGEIKKVQKEEIQEVQASNLFPEQEMIENKNRLKPVVEEVITPQHVEEVGLEEKKAGRYKLIEQFLEELEKDIKINSPKDTQIKPLKQKSQKSVYSSVASEDQVVKYHQRSSQRENYHPRVIREEKEVTTEKFSEDMFSDEDEKPSFWSKVGSKITNTYNKAKEKSKDLFEEVKEKISK